MTREPFPDRCWIAVLELLYHHEQHTLSVPVLGNGVQKGVWQRRTFAPVSLAAPSVDQPSRSITFVDIRSLDAVVVRPLRPNEGRVFLDIHSRSIRGIAAAHYPPEVINAWVIPLNEENVRGFLKNPDGEIRLIAEMDGEPVGLGVLVVPNAELRACYVVPEAARMGVGTALVREIERIATENGVERLELFASVNAEPFYASLGYESGDRTEHVLRTGQQMLAVRMTKRLRQEPTPHGALQSCH